MKLTRYLPDLGYLYTTRKSSFGSLVTGKVVYIWVVIALLSYSSPDPSIFSDELEISLLLLVSKPEKNIFTVHTIYNIIEPVYNLAKPWNGLA